MLSSLPAVKVITFQMSGVTSASRARRMSRAELSDTDNSDQELDMARLRVSPDKDSGYRYIECPLCNVYFIIHYYSVTMT